MSACERFLVLLIIGALGVSSVMTQLALMREMLGTFCGNEMVLGIILGNWLLLTGIGSWLGKTTGRLANPRNHLVAGLIFVAVIPLAQVFLLRAFHNTLFIRGATIGVTGTVAGSFVLLLPFCIVSGYLLTLACSILAPGEGPPAIGHVYIADSIGSITGGVVFSFVLIRFFDHFGMLCFPAVLNLALAGVAAFFFGSRLLFGTAAMAALGLVGLIQCCNMDAISTALEYPRQKVVFRSNSPYGKLLVTESAGQFTFIENGLPLFSTHNVEQIEETVHYAMAQRPDAHKVLLVSGGVTGTAKEILKYGAARVTYVELDPLIIAAGRKFLPGNLADPRIQVVNTDGRLFIKQANERFDVVIIDVPEPSTSQINRFYTVEFLNEVKHVLAPDGVLSFSPGRYENYVSPQLARMLASVGQTMKGVFRNVLVIPGGRVFFLVSDGELFADIAGRIERRGIPTRLVQRHYLEAMQTPDRQADIQRAMAQPAAVNRDFSPVLYYYHLLYWISQFKARFGLFEAALAGALGVYLLRLRPVPLVIFVSGFAASALEVVLLLGFQTLYGSVYRQLGVIITVFMTGLGVGAWIASRAADKAADSESVAAGGSVTLPQRFDGKKGLAALAIFVAAFAGLLPFVLAGLGKAGSGTFALAGVQTTIAGLAFLLAVLIGMEFSTACRLQFESGAATASRLYTADFVGAFLGALLPSTFLIPLIGVTAVCLLTAGLNVLGGAMVLLRKG
jgi:spermidine synthase